MSDGKSTDETRQENCRTEYSVVADGWKFFAGLRFIVAAFAVALQSALFAFYAQVMKNGSGKEQLAFAIAAVGLCITLSILLIEKRTVKFLLETMRRGTELEFGFGATNGFFHRLMEEFFYPKGVRKITRRIDGLAVIYVILFLLWLYLAVVNLIILKK
jgi:hypothetical protein